MKLIITLALVLFSSMLECEVKGEFIESKNFTSIKAEEGGLKFEGEATIQGKFTFEWEIRDDEPQWLNANFYPKEPFDKIFSIHKHHLPGDSFLSLVNPIKRVFDFLSREDAQKLIDGTLLKADGTATLKVKEYTYVVDCDQRYYFTEDFEVIKTSEKD